MANLERAGDAEDPENNLRVHDMYGRYYTWCILYLIISE